MQLGRRRIEWRLTMPFDVSTRSTAHDGDPHSERLGAMDPALLVPPGADAAATRTILVAEDDTNFRRALQHYLNRFGYHVIEAGNVASALEAALNHAADLVILDLDQGGGTSEVLTKIRRRSMVPVIVCSGRASERDRVSLLNLGADDFLTKPYSFAELEARVRAVLRRGSAAPTTTLQHGDLFIDQGTRTVKVRDSEVVMTRKEFDLLAFLASAPGRVFSREDLLERVWGSNGRWQGRSTVTEHIRRVRLKIETDPENPRWITTIRGIGYRFSDQAA
jgi:DNA-binding response OmpR family regulator